MGGTAVLARPSPLSLRPDRPPVRWERAWPAAWGAMLGAALFVLARHAMPDDALITLSFARNLAVHGCWCLSSGVVSNTATSPLNVWVLAAVIAVTGHAFWAVAAVLATALATLAMWLRHLGGPWAALLGSAVIATSPLLASAVGMETVLAVSMLVGVVRYSAERRPIAAGVLVGLAWLTRPDLLIAALAAVAVLAVLLRALRLLLALPVAAAVAAPWTVFSWWYFGSVFANSVAVKWANGAWDGGRSALSNPAYFYGNWPQVTLVTGAAMIAGVIAVGVAAWLRSWPAVALGISAAVHLAALISTSTPPTAYYLGPPFAGLALAFVLLLVRCRVPQVAMLLIAANVAVLAMNGSWWAYGVAPVRQNWATDAEYQVMARDLPAGPWILSTTEIGALAFYCADRCHVVDPVLSDPGRVDGYVKRWRASHPSLAALNYRRYVPPAPIPVAYELAMGYGDPGPGPAWRITRNPGLYQWARLVPASDPLALRN